MIFYTYLWLREDGTPYYVGKGSGNRYYWRGKNSRLKPPTTNRILVQEFPDEKSAFEAEKLLIAVYGRKDLGSGILINHTDGGEGFSGARHTEESKKKISEGLKGRHYGLGRIPWNKGLKMPKTKRKPVSQETKDKIRKTLKSKCIKPTNQLGYKHTEAAKVKIGLASNKCRSQNMNDSPSKENSTGRRAELEAR